MFSTEQPSDSLIKSQTGSGKASATSPILHDLMSLQKAAKREDGTLALIISPTRELSSQIHSVLTKLTQCCVNVVVATYLAGKRRKTKMRLRKAGGCCEHLVIA